MLFIAYQSLRLYVPLHARSKLGNTKQSHQFQIEMGREGEREGQRAGSYSNKDTCISHFAKW